eukprot:jgi/Galph1/5383/GphlegSOOS_G4073.1
MASIIKSVYAREILDSRGNPTVEVEVKTDLGLFRAGVPSGASTGLHEAHELRDNDKSRFLGKGVKKAVENVNTEIAKAVIGADCKDQAAIDKKMIELDGTQNKSRLGANAILGVSMAVCRAGAAAKGMSLYKHINELAGKPKLLLPVPAFNVINGGSHAGNKLAFQEFLILPVGASSFREALQMGAEVYQTLKQVIKSKYGLDATAVGDEGGFAPNIQASDVEEAVQLLVDAIDKAGHTGKVKIALDSAASEFWKSEKSCYDLDFKNPSSTNAFEKTSSQLLEIYEDMTKKFPIVSFEDPFHEEDFEGFAKMTKQIGKEYQIIGDDLLVTNPIRIKKAIEMGACNALLLKLNQIGTVTETIEANAISRAAKWGVMVSHRSGETEDSFIADLVVGLGTGEIKSGATCRSERLAKYNQLVRIEEELGQQAVYAGKHFRTPWKV